MSNYLTKSKFKLAVECPTKLFYNDRPNVYANKSQENSFLKALAEGGYLVEALARCYFPEGILIDADNTDKAIELTEKYLKNDLATLFQATITVDNFLIKADILIKDKDHLKLIEVKAKSINSSEITNIATKKNTISSKWRQYIADVAFQKYVLQKAFPNYRISTYLMLLDKDSICPTDGLSQKILITKDNGGKIKINITEPLTDDDLSIKLLRQINTDDYIDYFWHEKFDDIPYINHFETYAHDYLHGKKSKPIPKKECGKCQFKCSDGSMKSGFYECWQEALAFTDKDFEEPTVFELWRINKDKLLSNGTYKLKDVTEDDINIKCSNEPGLSSSERQWLQVQKVKNNDSSVYIDKDGLKEEMETWQFPLHFIDFETAMPPIPFNKGAHPYQGIAFQFSHHIMYEDGTIAHCDEYLNDALGINPNIDFVRKLKASLENDNGTIFRYADHENTYLNMILDDIELNSDCIADSVELIAFIKPITKSKNGEYDNRCMIDLRKLVLQYYYDPLTKGSNSIKDVYPAILKRSAYLQKKYAAPIYGASNDILSKNFKDFSWIQYDSNKIKNPYDLLEPINKEIGNAKCELLFEDNKLKEGGAATIAYMKMQFTQMSVEERKSLKNALLKYCELDTLAMAMIVEAWFDMVK